ncbi:MAG: type II secretion system F family protein [Puniceicoccales bacterium]|jgi:general secretion pathway protein F|nr:type II secretion system F family protein [Puniceicoccales bacterium]
MATFSYTGLDSSKKKTTGTINANDRKDAVRILNARGIQITSIAEKGAGGFGGAKTDKASGKKSGIGFGVNKSKIAYNFIKKFLQLYAGGLAVGDAVKIMRVRTKNPAEQVIAESIHKDICEGKTISDAMRSFSDVFGENIVCMIEAGEKTGNLLPIMRNLLDFLETKEAIKKKFISGMSYPIVVCCVATVVVLVFLFFLMPKIEKMLSSLGGDMPLITKVLMAVANFALSYGHWVLLCVIAAISLLISFRRTPNGKFATDCWMLKIPLIGAAIKENYYCQTSNLLGTLLGSGINTTEAMKLTENSSSNTLFKKNFLEAKKQILDGVSLCLAFEKNNVFPELALDILSVGENTGDIASSFKEVFHIYNQSLNDNLKRMTNIISTMAMGFAFGLVAALALSIVTSVMKLSTTMAK